MIKIGNKSNDFSIYSCQPKTKKELEKIIEERMIEQGEYCDLNDIDTSLITDMSCLFSSSWFNGNISKWDVSNVTDMRNMFFLSKFTGDISNWNVSNVGNMYSMFGASEFNGDISKWNISNVKNMSYTFFRAKFNQDISSWKINKDCTTTSIFRECSIKEEYKPKLPK